MITDFGWSDALSEKFEPFADKGYLPARVTAQHRSLWRLITEFGDADGQLSGHFMHNAKDGGFPVTGDWVAISENGDGSATIHGVLPRHTIFVRRAAGGVGEQVVVANIDVALLVCALNRDLNPRRVERYLVATRESGAVPVIVLTKADLSADLVADRASIDAIAGDVPVLVLSAKQGSGLDLLDAWLKPGASAVLLGSSGAGKSTLVNALMARDVMTTQDVRSGDDRGRHTTTHREMLRLPNGALIIDTPGMRELGLTAAGDEALTSSFDDVAELITACKFTDCGHGREPGCAVQGAIRSGGLSAARWEAYLKLERELEFERRKADAGAEAAHRQQWKKIHKAARARDAFKTKERDW